MVYCRNCGAEVEESDKFCKECGANQEEAKVVKAESKSAEKKEFDKTWFGTAIFIPPLVLITGIVFAIQGRKDADKLIMVSIIFTVFYSILIFIFF